MTGVLGMLATFRRVGSIAVNSNWGSSSGIQTTRTSGSRTLTVPPANPGVIRFSVSGDPGDYYYQKNGGSFTAFVHNNTLSVANGDTLVLRYVGTSPSTGVISVYDNTLGTLVGDFTGTVN